MNFLSVYFNMQSLKSLAQMWASIMSPMLSSGEIFLF